MCQKWSLQNRPFVDAVGVSCVAAAAAAAGDVVVVAPDIVVFLNYF